MSIKSDRAAIERTYEDTCNIYIFQKIKNKGVTSVEKTLLTDGVACALSQKSLNTTSQSNTVNRIDYDAKLFIAPEIIIPPGSHIEIMKFGRLYLFESAGEAFVYATHQEIMLFRKDKA